MARQRKFFVGCFDARIGPVLEDLWEYLPAFESVAVRSLDSTHVDDLSDLNGALTRAGIHAIPSAHGPLLDKTELYRACQKELFCGFDELWFLGQGSASARIPNELVLTSDALVLTDDDLPRIVPLLDDLACDLVMGDGCGLNCITTVTDFWNGLQRLATRLDH